MNEIVKASLWVNGLPIDLNPFTEEFVGKTVVGAVSPLRGAEKMKSLEIRLDQKSLSISVNGNDLELSDFPREIITNVVTALVSSLKGVHQIERLKLTATV